MSNILDQGDDGVFTVEGEDAKARWYQNYLRTLGGWPSEEEEPTIEQLSALNRRIMAQDIAPFTDFAIFVPFGQRVARASKFRAYVLSANGYTVKELPGPATFISGIQGAEIGTDHAGCGGPGKPPRVRDGHRGCHAFTHYAGTWCKTQTRWLGRLIRTG